MSSPNFITIPIGAHELRDFMQNLSKSISETFMLVFERRGLIPDDDESYALWKLAYFQSQLMQRQKLARFQGGDQPPFWFLGSSQKAISNVRHSQLSEIRSN
jgi:hypothetical protein